MINGMIIRISLMNRSPACWGLPGRRWRLSRFLRRVAHRVVHPADGVLNLAAYLVGLPVAPELGVANGLADRFLGGARHLLDRTSDSVPLHCCPLRLCRSDTRHSARRSCKVGSHCRSW